ncbi:hypothetical protein CTI12_AA344630 [Artemisia annua]|uniref:Uncharacterized protein n=1 Tax=Artemisia annua TaxID=35608 RepID=A0A2U1MT17_ARTAN|nr:hypothetical protein CTI12_AA344630 [Artemisia annua]
MEEVARPSTSDETLEPRPRKNQQMYKETSKSRGSGAIKSLDEKFKGGADSEDYDPYDDDKDEVSQPLNTEMLISLVHMVLVPVVNLDDSGLRLTSFVESNVVMWLLVFCDVVLLM